MDASCSIKVLPPQLVKKIAAGEVVERPASVVKELLDNAIDSGADRIAVTIEGGGKQLIRVTDNGGGMSAGDLRLAVLPHATSKLSREEDLFAIESLGFRGEALASISSIAQLSMVSRMQGAMGGHEIRVVGEQVELDGASGCPPGTTVEVRELFFNVPARRKFLRANSTESGHINEQFARAALAFPGISLELTNNKRSVHRLPATGDRLGRIAKLYSPELAEAMLPVRRDERGVAIEAYLAPPDRSRATTQWQYVFVNGRHIRDRFVQHAIKEAYRGLMEVNRHCVAFVFLTVDPGSLDVNVHPTKIEVRWADANMIHSQVLSALRETLQQADLTPALRADRATEASSQAQPVNPEQADRMRHELAAMLKTASAVNNQTGGVPTLGGSPAGNYAAGVSSGGDFAGSSFQVAPRDRTDPTGDPLDTWRALYSPPDRVDQYPSALRQTPAAPPPRTRAIQMHNLYLVVETPEGITIVDQHALHERVMYEQLRDRIAKGSLESQRLLLPETIRLTGQQISLLTERQELLDMLGIEVSVFGTDSVAVQAFPSLLKDTNVSEFMNDLVDLLDCQPNTSPEAVIHAVLDMMACKAAVKAGDALSQEEIDALLEKRHLLEKPSNCPHGRPTMLRFTKADLDRQFKRT